jgi:hypothetical protein
MSKAKKIPPPVPNQEETQSQLKDFITKYREFFANKAGSLLHGEQMLELGAKTADIQELEQLFFNPIQSLVDARKNIDNNLYQITDRMICFFIKRSITDGVIASAFKKVKEGEPLFYGITLVEDTFPNRENVLSFLTFYSSLELSEKIPVHFQFVPADLISSFKKVQTIA